MMTATSYLHHDTLGSVLVMTPLHFRLNMRARPTMGGWRCHFRCYLVTDLCRRGGNGVKEEGGAFRPFAPLAPCLKGGKGKI